MGMLCLIQSALREAVREYTPMIRVLLKSFASDKSVHPFHAGICTPACTAWSPAVACQSTPSHAQNSTSAHAYSKWPAVHWLAASVSGQQPNGAPQRQRYAPCRLHNSLMNYTLWSQKSSQQGKQHDITTPLFLQLTVLRWLGHDALPALPQFLTEVAFNDPHYDGCMQILGSSFSAIMLKKNDSVSG